MLRRVNKLISVTSLLLGSGRGPPAGQFEEFDDDVDELLGELLAAVHEPREDGLLYARLLEGEVAARLTVRSDAIDETS